MNIIEKDGAYLDVSLREECSISDCIRQADASALDEREICKWSQMMRGHVVDKCMPLAGCAWNLEVLVPFGSLKAYLASATSAVAPPLKVKNQTRSPTEI